VKITTDRVTSCLESVIDPEIGVSVVDLGLIYDVRIDAERISVDMTLTSSGCPMAGLLAGSVEQALREAFDGMEVEVNLVWDPPWTPERMSPELRERFGFRRCG
jgi:metal-sulfur cluster biosynthetic enzyme